MNIETIRELAAILKDANLSELMVEEGALKVKMCAASAVQYIAAPAETAQVQPPRAQAAPQLPSDPGMDFNDMSVVTSPLVGVFYESPAPDQPPFVKKGDRVKKGDVLCIVEAMKLMNEIAAETSGEIVDICVSNGDIVEFGQTLFKII